MDELLTQPTEAPPVDPAVIRAIQRPEPALLWLYVIQTLLIPPAWPLIPIVLIPLYFRYHTLRYRFEDDGVVVSWGILFRRETVINYERIQDIHVTRNLLERWLGIGTVAIQTASGTAGAEESIVGLSSYELVRDFLYQRMRGNEPAQPVAPTAPAAPADDPLALLTGIRDELRAARSAVEARA